MQLKYITNIDYTLIIYNISIEFAQNSFNTIENKIE